MTAPRFRLPTIPVIALLLAAGMAGLATFNTAMEATNTLGFCISCHEMESTVYQEYRRTAHYHNASGVRAVCADCHVPREWGRKLVRKIKASVELYHWSVGSIDTPEKFEAKRIHLAQRVWSYLGDSDSQECRNCHDADAMRAIEQSRFAAHHHAAAFDAGKTCIDCHKGITHRLPAEFLAEGHPAFELSEDEIDYAGEINDTCAGCHGEFAQGSGDGEYPRLAGLDAAYLHRQIEHFKTRERHNIPMLPYATERELPDEDVRIISAYIASIDLPASLPPMDEKNFNAFERLQSTKSILNIPLYPDGDASAGKRIYDGECAGCHGADGYGLPHKSAPQLAGQYSNYLKRQLDHFRNAGRTHGDYGDAAVFGEFSAREIDDLLAYLSVLDDTF